MNRREERDFLSDSGRESFFCYDIESFLFLIDKKIRKRLTGIFHCAMIVIL